MRGTQEAVNGSAVVEPTQETLHEGGSENVDSSACAPLAVDLDGTLFRTDLLFECIFRLVKQKPWLLPLLPFWLLRGRAFLKKRLFETTTLNYALLPVHQPLVEWLRAEKAHGRYLILATAANQQLAEQSVAHLGLFEVVLGSDAQRNLKGAAKTADLLRVCGSTFAYVGNSHADHAVWKSSSEAILVNASPSAIRRVKRFSNVTRVFVRPDNWLASLVDSLRPYQWVKNLLIFVPAFTSHTGVHLPVLLHSAVAFVAFSLCASGTYIVNDLLDLEEDRAHDNKKLRSFASGQCAIPHGVLLSISCLIAGLGVAFAAGRGLPSMLCLYILLTLAYSLHIKRFFLLDVLSLALLYTMRIIVGHVVTGIAFSMWLLSFSFFLFLSLAFSKRAAELIRVSQGRQQAVLGRGYLAADLPVITMAGICSGFLSSLVLALYINSDSVMLLYRRPAILWGILPLLLYYNVRLWIVCGRGELDDDPIVYTAKSTSTYLIATLALLLVVAATIQL